MSFITGGRIIFNKLIQNEVKNVWLYSGGAIMPLIDCFNNQKSINYFINTNEQNLGHSATGYAKSTGKPGVCIVTSGPGLTNLITPMLDAHNDSVPLVVLSGQVGLKSLGTNAFQEAPSVELTKVFTKWSYCVKNTEELPYVLDKAFKISMEGKKGVVHIDLPKCILSNKIVKTHLHNDNKKNKIEYINSNNINTYYESFSSNKSKIELITIISKIINNSNKPILCIGQGCNNYSKELTEFANKGNIPVTTTIHAVGVFNETNKLSLKFMGMHGSVYANKSIQESDCIIALGNRFDDRTTGTVETYAPEAHKAFSENRGGIIHVNIDESIFNTIIKTNYNINIDCGIFLNKILPLIKYKNRNDWLNKINKWKNDYPFKYDKDNKNIYSQDVLVELNKQIKDKSNYLFTTGVGNHQMFAAQFIDFEYPKSLITSGSMGVMGFGLPAAIGVAIGNRNKTVIDIDGDGSFLMTLSDLKTACQYNLKNLKILILNNKTLGMVDIWEKLFYENRITATDNRYAPNFDDVAKSFGIKSLRCDEKSELSETINEFLNTEGPILCDISTIHTPCFPLVAPGKSLNDMYLWNSNIKIDNNSIPPS